MYKTYNKTLSVTIVDCVLFEKHGTICHLFEKSSDNMVEVSENEW